MNLDTWNKLGPELHGVVNEVFESVAHDAVLRDLGQANAHLQVWLNAGVELIYPFTAEEVKWYTSLYGQDNWNALKEKASPEVFAKVQELVPLPADAAKMARP